MASSTRKQCGKENDCKQAGVANCEGCSLVFCLKHFNEHRQSVNEEMNVILSEYNNFNNAIIEESDSSNTQPLLKEIDDWEQESIRKIEQRATELRSEFFHSKTLHIEYLSAKLRTLCGQLKQTEEHDGFTETDLRQWKKTLDDLRLNFTSPSIIEIKRDDNIPLIRRISLDCLLTGKNEVFDRVFNDNVRIEEDGKVVTSTKVSWSYTEIRGKNNYTFDCHKIHLQVEHSSNAWTFLGINSKSTPLQQSSFLSKSSYGWCNNNYIYSNGSYRLNTTNPLIQIKKNDKITLIFDCDNRKISMVNESANTKHELTVDIDKCPFPWQLHVIFRQLNSCIRILTP